MQKSYKNAEEKKMLCLGRKKRIKNIVFDRNSTMLPAWFKSFQTITCFGKKKDRIYYKHTKNMLITSAIKIVDVFWK